MSSSVRILVVEDFEPFRRFLCAMFQTIREEVQVSEASDGVLAVEQAQKLRPDLILLDIGLPRLNGIEAARQIRKLSPESKILFVSQEFSPDLAHAAFDAGANGYIVKTDVGSELVTGVNAVLRGEVFASTRLADHDFCQQPAA